MVKIGNSELESLLAYVGVLVVVVLLWRPKKARKPKFPEVPGGLPIIGHAHLIGSTHRVVDKLDEWAEKYGVCEFRILGRRFLCLADAEEVRNLAKHRPRKVQRLGILREAVEALFPGLVSAELPQWTVERRLVTPAFSHANLAKFLPSLHDISKRLVAAAQGTNTDAGDLQCRV